MRIILTGHSYKDVCTVQKHAHRVIAQFPDVTYYSSSPVSQNFTGTQYHIIMYCLCPNYSRSVRYPQIYRAIHRKTNHSNQGAL